MYLCVSFKCNNGLEYAQRWTAWGGGCRTGESHGSTQNMKTQKICLMYDSEGELPCLHLNVFSPLSFCGNKDGCGNKCDSHQPCDVSQAHTVTKWNYTSVFVSLPAERWAIEDKVVSEAETEICDSNVTQTEPVKMQVLSCVEKYISITEIIFSLYLCNTQAAMSYNVITV